MRQLRVRPIESLTLIVCLLHDRSGVLAQYFIYNMVLVNSTHDVTRQSWYLCFTSCSYGRPLACVLHLFLTIFFCFGNGMVGVIFCVAKVEKPLPPGKKGIRQKKRYSAKERYIAPIFACCGRTSSVGACVDGVAVLLAVS